MVVADGAGDCHIAYDELQKSGVLPNIIVRHYDQAHGARRLTSRPWSADEFTQDVVDTLICARCSLTDRAEQPRLPDMVAKQPYQLPRRREHKYPHVRHQEASV